MCRVNLEKNLLAAPETGNTPGRSEGRREHSWKKRDPFMSLSLFPHPTTVSKGIQKETVWVCLH